MNQFMVKKKKKKSLTRIKWIPANLWILVPENCHRCDIIFLFSHKF